MNVKFTVLVDDRIDRESLCSSQHGLSLYIECDNKKLLLDTGETDVFLKNSEILNCNIDEVDAVILSHGHYDHGTSLNMIKKGKEIIMHPECFIDRYSKRTNKYGGINQSQKQLSKEYELILSKKPYELYKNIFFLGEIPRKNDYEAKEFPMVLSNGEDDSVYDDSGIVINTAKGIIVISGCAHAGICNTIEHAKQVTNNDKVYAVIGGLHLKDIDLQCQKTIEYIRNNNINKVFLGHCTSDEVCDEFIRLLGDYSEVVVIATGKKYKV